MASQIDLSNVVFPDVMDLRTAAIYLGLSEMRVRTLAREETLPGGKDESGTWQFTKNELDIFKETPRARRGGGRKQGEGKAWIIKVKYADLEGVKEALANFGIELQPRYNYAKQAEYRAKKAAEAAAEAAAKK